MTSQQQTLYNASATSYAAASITERDLIGKIVDDLTDVDARKVYSTWLRERGDRRANFADTIRRFVDEMNASDKCPFYLPLSSGYNQSWVRMLGYGVFGTLRFGDSNENWWNCRHILVKYARPALCIRAELADKDESLPVDGSKFGGIPCLPRDMDWPATTESGPMSYIAQINLAEISLSQVARTLPTSGWLIFFAIDEHVGASDDKRSGVHVCYVDGRERLELRESPISVNIENRGGARLLFSESFDLPDNRDFCVDTEDRQKLEEFGLDMQGTDTKWLESESHLMGYARHYRTSDPSPSAEHINLACFGSIDALGWNWCDGEHLAFWLHPSELAKNDFSKVYGYAS